MMLPGYVAFWTAIAVGCVVALMAALAPLYVLLFLIWRAVR